MGDTAAIEEMLDAKLDKLRRELLHGLADELAGRRTEVPLAYSYSAAAKLLDVSVRTLNRMVARGELMVVTVGGTKKVPAREVNRVVEPERPPGRVFRRSPGAKKTKGGEGARILESLSRR